MIITATIDITSEDHRVWPIGFRVTEPPHLAGSKVTHILAVEPWEEGEADWVLDRRHSIYDDYIVVGDTYVTLERP